MKNRLEQICDEVAKENGLTNPESWHFPPGENKELIDFMKEVCRRYGIEEYNNGITDALKSFDPMFNIEPKVENIIAIIEKLKEVHASIKSLKKIV